MFPTCFASNSELGSGLPLHLLNVALYLPFLGMLWVSVVLENSYFQVHLAVLHPDIFKPAVSSPLTMLCFFSFDNFILFLSNVISLNFLCLYFSCHCYVFDVVERRGSQNVNLICDTTLAGIPMFTFFRKQLVTIFRKQMRLWQPH